jgi:hypothetical protein
MDPYTLLSCKMYLCISDDRARVLCVSLYTRVQCVSCFAESYINSSVSPGVLSLAKLRHLRGQAHGELKGHSHGHSHAYF